MEARTAYVDVLRAASTLYVVGFWHLASYAEALPYRNVFTSRLTVVVMGLFVFLSGFLAGDGDQFRQKGGARGYVTRRLLRIYPLYLSGCIAFVLCGLLETSGALKAVFLLSMFDGPPPRTLWFVAMLLVFSSVVPLLVSAAGNSAAFSIRAAAMLGLLAFLYLTLPAADPRLLIYATPFLLGIYWANARNQGGRHFKTAVLLLALASSAVSLADSGPPARSLASIPLVGMAPLCIVLFCQAHAQRIRAGRTVACICYASFAMYLFHRPVLEIMTRLYFPPAGAGQVAYLVLVCLPVVMALSWLVQRGYDGLLTAARARGPG